jgi:hypothetical protein
VGTVALSGPKAAYLFVIGVTSNLRRGRIMKLNSLFLRNSLLLVFVLFGLSGLCATVSAQEQQESDKSKVSVTETKKAQNLKPLPQGEDLESKQEGPEFLRRRQDYFFKPRAFPLGFIPRGARERAVEQKRQMYIREGRLGSFVVRPEVGFLAPASLTTSPWTAIGPQPTSSPFFNPPFTSGRVTALAVNPNNANNVYLGGADGGLWVSTDGGNTWNPLAATENPPSASMIPTVAVGAIAVDLTTCGSGSTGICTTVYVGTGEDNFAGDNIYGEGVLNCTITAGTPPTAACTQDSTFHSPSPLSGTRGGPMIGALAVDRLSGSNSILLAGVRTSGTAIESGVWCSSNKGATWTEVLPTSLTNGAGDPGTDIAFASDGTAWVALGFPRAQAGNGIYKSSAPVTSCTITFNAQMLPSAFTASNIGKITLALAPSKNDVIYAAIADGTTGTDSATLLGVVRSTNATMATPTWTQLTDPLVSAATGFCTGQCLYDMALAVDPLSPDVVYAGGSSQNPIIRTLNGTTTATWADVTAPTGTATVPHVDTHAFAFAGDGSKLWVGNDGGVWATNTPSGTLSWANMNGPTTTSTGALNITQFYPGVSIHPANPSFAMGGTQDNDVQVDQAYLSPTPALLWQDVGLGCDGGFTAIDLAIPSTSYGECEYLPGAPGFPIIAVTFNGDGILSNGFLANSGIDNTDRGSFIPPLVIDSKNTQNLYFGTCRVWQTKDGGNSWAAISPDVTTSSHPTTCPIPTGAGQPSASLSTIAVAPGDSNTVYVGSDEGEIEVTSNAGTAWSSIVTPTLPSRSVTQVAVDPTNAAIAYAVFSGFGTCTGCDLKGHVFKTINGTAGAATTWVDISGTTTKLPDIPVNAIVIDPDDASHNTLYVGTDIGAFSTTDGGVNWSPLGAASSMPNAQILSLTIHNPSRTLRAATHGRGVWDLNLGPGPNTPAFEISTLSPFMATAPGAQTTLTVDGTGFTATSKVMWNGSQRNTTFGNATQLTATITAADLGAGGVAQVSVMDGANTTNSLPFTVLSPAATISGISPQSTPVQTPNPTTSVNVQITGTGFGSNTQVLWNGAANGVTKVVNSSTSITATLPAALLGPFGSTDSLIANNPPPAGGGVAATFVVVAPAPANDNFTNAITVTPNGSGMYADTEDSSGAGIQTGEPFPPCAVPVVGNPTPGLFNTIWYRFTPSSAGTVTATTVGSSYDTVLATWTGSSLSALAPVVGACNDDINPGIILQSQVSFTAVAGITYLFQVGSFGTGDPNPLAFGGKAVFNLTFSGTTGGNLTVSGSATAVTTAPAASGTASGTSTITVSGATAATTITCGSLPGVTCNALSIPQGTTSGTLTINVVDPSSTMTAMNLPASPNLWAATPPSTHSIRAGWWTLSGSTGLAAILLLFLPGRKRYRVALGFGLVCLMSFALGCGGYGGGGGGGGGLASTMTSFSVASTKVASGTSMAFTVKVTSTGTPPTGMAEILEGTTVVGSAAISGGQATISTSSLAVGTHTLSASYLGDAYTKPSQTTGSLNITITGTTQLPITGASGGTNANANVSLTIN